MSRTGAGSVEERHREAHRAPVRTDREGRGGVAAPATRAARTAGATRDVLGATRSALGGRDLAGAAATATYFAGIAVVPWLLLVVWSTTWTNAGADAEARWLRLAALVPPDMGARPAWASLVGAGAHAGLLTALVLLLPASFWGEGVRRACLALAPAPDRFTGWRARLAAVALVVLVPAAGAVVLGVGTALVPLAPDGGGGGAVDLGLRVLVTFTTAWLLLSLALVWVFRVVAPHPPGAVAAVVGALGTGSFLAGFLHGFQLFLAIPIDVGLPFAGLGTVGAVVAVGLWLYLLHVVLLVGWTTTRALDERLRPDRAAT